MTNFYTRGSRRTLSTVESIVGRESAYDSITDLVFVNKYTRDIASINYNFEVNTYSFRFEIKKEDLVKMMWRFRMTRSDIREQLRNQFNHEPDMGILLSII